MKLSASTQICWLVHTEGETSWNQSTNIIAVLLGHSRWNKDIFGTIYTFKHATVKLPNGEIVNGDVKEWAREDKTDSVHVSIPETGAPTSQAQSTALYNDRHERT